MMIFRNNFAFLHLFLLKRLNIVAGYTKLKYIPKLIQSTSTSYVEVRGKSIYYNPKWFSSILDDFCTVPFCQIAIAFGILAHEMAHILQNDPLGYWINPLPFEKEADEFAGILMGYAGIHPKDFLKVISAISNPWSSSHPDRNTRYWSILNAYNQSYYECEGYYPIRFTA